MKKRIQLMMVAALAIGGLAFASLVPATTVSASAQQEICEGSGGEWNGKKCAKLDDTGKAEKDLSARIQDIVNVLLFVLGAIAVIVIVIAGIKYVTSDGDSGKITSAKNTILYAVVGLVVAILAYAIVNFVVSAF